MNAALQIKIGTIALAECEKFIRQSLASSINAFLASQKDKTKVSDIKPEAVVKFVEDFAPQPVKAPAKRSDSKAAWQGFAKLYREEHPGCKSKAIGVAWNKGKGVSKEDWTRYVELGNAPKTEKVRAKSTGNAWNGFRSEFKRLNAKKDSNDETKLEPGQVTIAASNEWKKVRTSLTESQISKYQKIADKIKADKEKEEKKKEDARKKREANRVAKKAKDAKAEKKEEEDSGSGEDSDSDDDKPLGDGGNDSDSGDEFQD